MRQRALALYEKALGSDHFEVAACLLTVAGFRRDQGRYTDAEALYRRSVAIREQAMGQGHPDVATSLAELGAFLDATGDRVASVALLMAFAVGVGTTAAYQASLALVAASLLLAFTRARAESVGAEARIRTLHRSGRSIWLSSALMVGPSVAVMLDRPPSDALLVAFWTLTAVTAAALAVVVARTVRRLA